MRLGHMRLVADAHIAHTHSSPTDPPAPAVARVIASRLIGAAQTNLSSPSSEGGWGRGRWQGGRELPKLASHAVRAVASISASQIVCYSPQCDHPRLFAL